VVDKVLVTGGGGFLGGAIARRLMDQGAEIRSFSRGSHPRLERAGIEQVRGDLADLRAVKSACRGCELVFHVAAKAGLWGRDQDFYAANVDGTRNVLEACTDLGIRYLVYTSSPSVIFDGRDQEGIDESIPYPDHYKASYPKTKAEAEKAVLRADCDRLKTVSLRPHLIWGPGDNLLTPGILAKGRSGRLRRIGSGNKLVDFTYIDNAAEAHIRAAEALLSGRAIGGKAYFISQSEPWPLWDFINRLMEIADYPRVKRRIPTGLAYRTGAVCEWMYRILPLKGEPPVTRFMVEELTTAHWYDNSAARRDLGYKPIVSMEEGMIRLQQWIRKEGRKQWGL